LSGPRSSFLGEGKGNSSLQKGAGALLEKIFFALQLGRRDPPPPCGGGQIKLAKKGKGEVAGGGQSSKGDRLGKRRCPGGRVPEKNIQPLKNPEWCTIGKDIAMREREKAVVSMPGGRGEQTGPAKSSSTFPFKERGVFRGRGGNPLFRQREKSSCTDG